MDNKKLKVFILLGVLLVSLLLGLYSLGDIKYSNKDGLSYDEKKADAEYLMNFLEKTYPYFDEVKATTGQGLLKEKKKIIASISKTPSDKEFYFQIRQMLRRFTYGQINVGTDSMSNAYLHLDKSETQGKGYFEKLKESKLKWEPIQKEYSKNLSDSFKYICNINAMYINGSYYITMSQNPEVHVGDEVIRVNDMSVDEYSKTIQSDKYFAFYDYTHEKYVVQHLFSFKDYIPKNMVIKNYMGEEKKVNVTSYDKTKPILENGFKAFETNFIPGTTDNNQGNFLNIFEENKVVTLNFSAFSEDDTHMNNDQEREKLFNIIDKSDYLILDLRGSTNDALFRDILTSVLPMNLSYSNYYVMEKNEINDAYIEHYRISSHPFNTEVTSSISSLEKVYPLTKYHILKNNTIDLKGLSKYKGKIFILYDTYFSGVITKEILKTAIDQNSCTVISNGKFNLQDYADTSLSTSVILPNSNLTINAQNVKVVDSNGTFIGKVVATPQVLVQQDMAKVIEKLKNGEGYILEVSKENRYTNKDEYYNEVLKLIK